MYCNVFGFIPLFAIFVQNVWRKGSFLYAGSVKELAEAAQGKIWICKVSDEGKAREIERKGEGVYGGNKRWENVALSVLLLSLISKQAGGSCR
jgi:hypothetical protein